VEQANGGNFIFTIFKELLTFARKGIIFFGKERRQGTSAKSATNIMKKMVTERLSNSN
jgi:hypothetical protein